MREPRRPPTDQVNCEQLVLSKARGERRGTVLCYGMRSIYTLSSTGEIDKAHKDSSSLETESTRSRTDLMSPRRRVNSARCTLCTQVGRWSRQETSCVRLGRTETLGLREATRTRQRRGGRQFICSSIWHLILAESSPSVDPDFAIDAKSMHPGPWIIPRRPPKSPIKWPSCCFRRAWRSWYLGAAGGCARF